MRSSGILMHISSLPSPYGIGTFGKKAYEFVDFLYNAGQKYWQVLPLCPTGYGDSPYQSVCGFAGNLYFIDLEMLCEQGYITENECREYSFFDDPDIVDYGKLYLYRKEILKRAFDLFDFANDVGYNEFCKKNADWLEDYALFAAIKDENNGAPFFCWEQSLARREKDRIQQFKIKNKVKIDFYKVAQYWFFTQWLALKKYANSKQIKIIGDLPIYVSHDSVEFWANSDLFLTDTKGNPALVAGVPPDDFCEQGQLWGNPIYDWEYHKKSGYKWWIKRMRRCFEMFDTVRVDHFRGFEAYYAIPYGSKDASNGKWYNGPNIELFDAIKAELGEISVIAEDLGYITPSLRGFLDKTGFAGMNVLQFAFSVDEESQYLPHNHNKNSVVYTGTHDNDTILGWFETAPKANADYAKQYLRLNEAEGYNWGMIKAALASCADTCIITMQDLIGANSTARMNTPATEQGNWRWRIADGCANDWLAGILKDLTEVYKR